MPADAGAMDGRLRGGHDGIGRYAQALTGEGISETVRIGLRWLILETQHPEMATDKLLQLARVVSE